VKIFQGRIPARDIGGPILIVQTAGQQAKVGLESLLHFMAVISINLGILNLLPIPILDGGHMLMVLVEGVIRRDVPFRFRKVLVGAGAVAMLILLVTTFFNDLGRLGWIRL